jgi:hypothetical protein
MNIVIITNDIPILAMVFTFVLEERNPELKYPCGKYWALGEFMAVRGRRPTDVAAGAADGCGVGAALPALLKGLRGVV